MTDLLLGWRKIGASLSAVTALMAGFILFLPDFMIQKAGLLRIRNENLAYIGVAFSVGLSFFLASTIEAMWNFLVEICSDRKLLQNRLEILKNLDVTP